MIKINSRWNTLSPPQRLYHMPVPVIGLTGGVATGKSTVSKLLKQQGIAIIDADVLVKRVYTQEHVINEIAKLAPSAVTEGIVDFKTLRPLFFNDEQLQLNIEKLIYAGMPKVFVEDFETNVKSKQDFIIYDVPLLFEKKLAPLVDAKVCVWCSAQTQIDRLVQRDGIDEELAKKMLAHQWDIDQKRKESDLVIDNSKSLKELERNVLNFIQILLITS